MVEAGLRFATHPIVSADAAGARFRDLGGLCRTIEINGKHAELREPDLGGETELEDADVAMIEEHYGVLLGGAVAAIAARQDAYDAERDEAADHAPETFGPGLVR